MKGENMNKRNKNAEREGEMRNITTKLFTNI